MSTNWYRRCAFVFVFFVVFGVCGSRRTGAGCDRHSGLAAT